MAINVPQVNPRLANIQAPNLPRINVGGAIESGVNLGQKLQGIREQDQLQSLVQDQGQAALGGDQDALNQIALQGPDGAELAGSLQQIVASRNEQQVQLAQRQIKKQGTFLASLVKAKPEVQRRKIFEQANKLLSEGDRDRGGEFLRISQLKDPLEIQGEIESGLVLSQGGDKFLQGFIPQAGSGAKFQKTGSFIVEGPDGQPTIATGVFDPNTGTLKTEVSDKSFKVLSKLGETAQQQQQREIETAGGKEEAKQEVKARIELATAPEIAKSIALAKAEGVTEADDRNRLASLDSNMQGLTDVVDNLKELGEVATFTMKGRAFDALTREFGFGVGDGADARAKFIAIVDNQILPLLKQTFGAAFTAKEGETLKKTLGDPNSSPSEKNAQLDAFIEAKRRDADNTRLKLGISAPKGQEISVPIKDLSDEALFQ